MATYLLRRGKGLKRLGNRHGILLLKGLVFGKRLLFIGNSLAS